jgi:TorA maturation chaperone TorD
MSQALAEFRRQYYECLAALLIREPTAELIDALRAQALEARAQAAAEVDATLGEGWRQLAGYLRGRHAVAEAVRQEYTRLFIGPADPAVYPYESYYRDGVLLGEALLDVRGFLRQVGFAVSEGCCEPEDHVAVELDIMRQLIVKAEQASDAERERWYRLQSAFLHRHLLPWVPQLCRDLERHAAAPFYGPVAKILRGFLALEQQVLQRWAPSEPDAPAGPRMLPWTGPTVEVDDAG